MRFLTCAIGETGRTSVDQEREEQVKNCIYMKVGPLIYEIRSDEPFRVRKEYKEFFFRSLGEIEGYAHCRRIRCEVRMVDQFSNIEGTLVYENPERMIFRYQDREYRLHAGQKGVCGIYRETGEKDSFEIELSRAEIPAFEINLLFMEMLALEKYLLEEHALVLHSSYITWKGKGIAFTAPSGTGKSTQAELWRRYAGAEIINGDRSVLWWNQETERFVLCGLPFCGSSQINRNVSAPLLAVVFLSQAPENHAELCPQAESILKLFGEMSINQWNPDMVGKSLRLIEKTVSSVPMIRLACNMEPKAVKVLQNALKQSENRLKY